VTKPKICYIVPEYKNRTFRHYQHLYEYFDILSRKAQLFVIIESGEGFLEKPSSFKYILARFRNPFLSRLELFIYILTLRLVGYDVFYSHYAYRGALISSFVTKILKGRSYLWHCISVEKMLKESGASNEMQQGMFNTLNEVQYLVTGSNFMANMYSDWGRFPLNKVVVVPNYISLGRFDPSKYDKTELKKKLNLPLDKKIILFVHSFGAGKGVSFLPFIFNEMNKDRDDLFFVVVGGPWPNNKEHAEQTALFKDGISKHDLWNKVKWTNNIPNVEVQKFYFCADLFIMPSKFEGFSRVLLESMAMGTPFVSTTGGGGVLEYTSPLQQEYIIPPEDIEDFPKLCLKLLSDKPKMMALSRDGLEWVKRYSYYSVFNVFWDRIVLGHHSHKNPKLS
jgi:glycosyltransferase involved in cell wall biosynthesis